MRRTVDENHDLVYKSNERASAGLPQPSLTLPRDTSGRASPARTGLALRGDWRSWRCVWWSVRVRVQRESGLLPIDLPPVVAAVEDFLEKGRSAQKSSVVT